MPSITLVFKPLLHHIVRARTSWLQRKSADLQGTLNYLRFYNKISRSHRPHNENWHAHFLCLQGYFTRDCRTCILLASVARSPNSLEGFAHAV